MRDRQLAHVTGSAVEKMAGSSAEERSSPAVSHPSPQGLGKKSLCGGFTVAQEFVPLDRGSYTDISLAGLIGAQNAPETPDFHRSGLGELVRQRHNNLDGRTALKDLGKIKVQPPGADLAGFRGNFADYRVVHPANG
jgi:hypothetical protein